MGKRSSGTRPAPAGKKASAGGRRPVGGKSRGRSVAARPAGGGSRPAHPRSDRSREGGVMMSGIFSGHARGFGFIRADDPEQPDVFIPPASTRDALHGDRVRVIRYPHGRDQRPWGEVIAIEERCPTPVIGYYNGRMVVPRDPRFCAWIKVRPSRAGEAAPGDLVMVEVTSWPEGPRGAEGRIIEVLGASDDPGIESRIALRAHGFAEEFPPEVEEQARAAARAVDASELAGREDLRPLFTVTIDPERARDYDDAVAVEEGASGFRLWVSIADVSYYVTAGSALDLEAYERATSVYLPDRAVPMLPPELSSGICSLRPGEDRMTLTVELEFDRQGKRRRARFYPAVIRSDHRLTYDQVEEMERSPELRQSFPGAWERIEVMRRLAELRRRNRLRRGAIDLDVPEAEVVLDAEGEPVTIARRMQTWSHQLVEEFMLAANEAVAEYLTDQASAMVYRVHEPPSPKSVEALAEMLAPLGFQLLVKGAEPERIRPEDYQRMIREASGGRYETMVKMLCLRSMMQARYHAELLGHFGLASERYCHFTSPIRRYPDLIVHRLLRRTMGAAPAPRGRGEPAPADLAEAARHCSERERAAEETEREMVDYYGARWMAKRLGEEFTGMVTGVTSAGLFVELEEAMVEGFVPMDSLDPAFQYFEKEMAVRGRGREEYRIGDRVQVWSEAVDIEQRRIAFRLIGPAG